MIEDTILILLIALITALFSEGMLSLVTVCSFNPYWLGEGACWKVVGLGGLFTHPRTAVLEYEMQEGGLFHLFLLKNSSRL